MKCPNCDLDHTHAWLRTFAYDILGPVARQHGAWMLCSCGEQFRLPAAPFPEAADPQGRW